MSSVGTFNKGVNDDDLYVPSRRKKRGKDGEEKTNCRCGSKQNDAPTRFIKYARAIRPMMKDRKGNIRDVGNRRYDSRTELSQEDDTLYIDEKRRRWPG